MNLFAVILKMDYEPYFYVVMADSGLEAGRKALQYQAARSNDIWELVSVEPIILDNFTEDVLPIW